VSIVLGLFYLALILNNLFPSYSILTPFSAQKPIILYYNYAEQPFTARVFPSVVSFASLHHFNTLMIVVHIGDRQIFNDSTLLSFYLIAKSNGVTFVPSYYINSFSDNFNASGFSRINLDMERLSQANQLAYYDRTSPSFSLVAVTMPVGEDALFKTKMLIVESYAPIPIFWLGQLSYPHGGTVCSVLLKYIHNEREYRQEHNYCLRSSGGVMVFDYPELAKSGFS
jgi:hypothetical protein